MQDVMVYHNPALALDPGSEALHRWAIDRMVDLTLVAMRTRCTDALGLAARETLVCQAKQCGGRPYTIALAGVQVQDGYLKGASVHLIDASFNDGSVYHVAVTMGDVAGKYLTFMPVKGEWGQLSIDQVLLHVAKGIRDPKYTLFTERLASPEWPDWYKTADSAFEEMQNMSRLVTLLASMHGDEGLMDDGEDLMDEDEDDDDYIDDEDWDA